MKTFLAIYEGSYCTADCIDCYTRLRWFEAKTKEDAMKEAQGYVVKRCNVSSQNDIDRGILTLVEVENKVEISFSELLRKKE